MNLTQLKRLQDFTNPRGIVPGLGMLHVDEKARAWASDGEIECFLPKIELPHDVRWSVNAEQFVKLVGAALTKPGHAVEVELTDDGEVLVGAGSFAAKTALGKTENHVEPLYKDLKPTSKQCVVHKLEKPKALTEALKCAASFAATDAAGGVHWTAVLLRKGWIYSSNQGYSVFGANLVDEKLANEEDILIPARACAMLGENTVFELLLNYTAGLGAFRLADGGMIVFRMVAAPDTGYPDASVILAQAPKDAKKSKVWADLDDNFGLSIAQALVVCDPKNPQVSLKHEDKEWYLYAKGPGGEVSVDLPGFTPEGDDVSLAQLYWGTVLNVASEVASKENMLWFRSHFEVPDKGGAFDIIGTINGQLADEAAVVADAGEAVQAAPTGEAEDF